MPMTEVVIREGSSNTKKASEAPVNREAWAIKIVGCHWTGARGRRNSAPRNRENCIGMVDNGSKAMAEVTQKSRSQYSRLS